MLTAKGPQCDVCDHMITAKDAAAGDFYKFMFPMVARPSAPKEPAMLVACVECQPKLARAVKAKDFNLLPPSRLRKILEKLTKKYTVRNIHVQ